MNVDLFEKTARDYLDRYIVLDNGDFVAGGVFPRIFHGLPVRDIDLYTKDVQKTIDFYASLGYIYAAGSVQSNYVSMYLPKEGKGKKLIPHIHLDIIGFHFDKTPNYINSFDFGICQVAMTTDTFVVRHASDIESKRLVFNGNYAVPVSYGHMKNNILTRINKYTRLGFTIDDANMGAIYKFLLSTNLPPSRGGFRFVSGSAKPFPLF